MTFLLIMSEITPNIKLPISIGLKRLNSRQPQYPTDSYFIKGNRELLHKFISDQSLILDLEKRGTPRYIQ